MTSLGNVVVIVLYACIQAKLLQSCPTLCNPMDCSLTDSSIHGILQARRVEWVVRPSSRGSSDPQIKLTFSALAGGFFTSEPPGKPIYICIPKSNL